MIPSTLPTATLRGVENTVQQLLNDMRTIAEARCRTHGTSYGTTANAAAVLLPCIAVEFIATRTRSGESKEEALRRTFRDLAAAVGYGRYETVGFPFYSLVRRGLAHGFYPGHVQLANGPKAHVGLSFWIDAESQRSFCVDEVGGHAESRHLVHNVLGIGDHVVLHVSVQHLYIDVKVLLERFLQRLATDRKLQQLVEKNDEDLLQAAALRTMESLSTGDFMNLGL